MIQSSCWVVGCKRMKTEVERFFIFSFVLPRSDKASLFLLLFFQKLMKGGNISTESCRPTSRKRETTAVGHEHTGEDTVLRWCGAGHFPHQVAYRKWMWESQQGLELSWEQGRVLLWNQQLGLQTIEELETWGQKERDGNLKKWVGVQWEPQGPGPDRQLWASTRAALKNCWWKQPGAPFWILSCFSNALLDWPSDSVMQKCMVEWKTELATYSGGDFTQCK